MNRELPCKPVVCAIAGMDPSGHAGLLADLRTLADLGCHGTAITTSVTLQNASACMATQVLSEPDLTNQWRCLMVDTVPTAVKVGLCLSDHQFDQLRRCQMAHPELLWVQDPVASASQAGTTLTRPRLLPGSIFTPNLPELSQLLDRPLHTPKSIELAAHACLALGAQAVLVKGGHAADPDWVMDYFCSANNQFWLRSPRHKETQVRGTGCVLSSSLAAFLAHGKGLHDAVVLACAYVRQGLRLSYRVHSGAQKNASPLGQGGWPGHRQDFPQLHPRWPTEACQFKPLKSLGLYVLVDSVAWLERLLKAGVKTLQLRVKDLQGPALHRAISEAIALGRAYQAQVFINDYWQRALALGAWGVHLGQQDLQEADLPALARAGIHLGISAHSEAEWCRALTYSPSYIALGAAFNSQTKAVAVLNPDDLQRWLATLQAHVPVVVIGGINRHTVPALVARGVQHIAVASAVTQAADPEAECARLAHLLTSTSTIAPGDHAT